MMSIWEDVVRASLLGTERQPFSVPSADGAVGDVLAQVEKQPAEAKMLSAAAVLTQHQRAGRVAATDTIPLVSPAPENDLPRTSTRSGQHLRLMLTGKYADALDEWLEAVADAARRVPEELLPALLSYGAQKTDRREGVLKVIGERGRWLAGLNSQWSYAISLMDESEWETATGPARVLILQTVRAADPTRGRGLIESTWETEHADDRAGFIGCLAHGLSMEDEPFLENCLDDRSKKVREAAADMLGRLPESRLVGRMIERLEGIIVLKEGRKPSFEISLPDECDEGMIRDGVNPKPAISDNTLGEKGQWIVQMLRTVSPDFWSAKWGKTASELVKSAEESKEWSHLLLTGWVGAARFSPSRDWPAALLRWDTARGGVIAELPHDMKEAVIKETIEANAYKNSYALLQLISYCPRPWSMDYARFTTSAIRSYFAKTKPESWEIPRILTRIAYAMPTDLSDAIPTLLPDKEEWKGWKSFIDEMILTLEFRREMLEEIQR